MESWAFPSHPPHPPHYPHLQRLTRDEGRSPPLVFMIPSARLPSEKAMESLSLALVGAGLATFRFSFDRGWAPEQIPIRLAQAMSRPETANSHVVFLGFAEGADYIAREYYELYPVRFPYACVLLSPSVLSLYLNNITCPYLILHGRKDPLFKDVPYKAVQDAVNHHQMRYGDLTTNFVFPELDADLGTSLGGEPFDERVVRLVANWLVPASVQGLRPQEPLGGTAA